MNEYLVTLGAVKRGRERATYLENNKKGISLIALVITIIVIIILAAIVITMSLDTPEQANYAKFTSDASSIQEMVTIKYIELYGEKALKGEETTRDKVYDEIIKEGGKTETVGGAIVKELDEEKLGQVLPEYTNSNGEKSTWYVDTETDKVYLIPGYEYDGKVYVTATEDEEEIGTRPVTIRNGVDIVGTLKVGETLTANVKTEIASTSTVTYEWWTSNSSIATSGNTIGTGTSYVLTESEAGKYIGIAVTETTSEGQTKTYLGITRGKVVSNIIEVEKTKLTKPRVTGTYTYTGSSQTVSVSGYDSSTMTISGNTATDAGTYTVTIGIKDTTNYEWIDGTTSAIMYNWSISPKSVGTLTISGVNASYNYTGSEIKPTVTISGLTSGTDYTVAYENNVNVGTATITITGKGNYTGTITKTFKITSAGIIGIIATGFDGTYDGKAHGISITLTGTSEGATIRYGTVAGTYNLETSPAYTNVGTYTIYYEVTKTNYNAERGSAVVKISKREVTITALAQTISSGETIDTSTNKVSIENEVEGHIISSVTLTADMETTDTGTITASNAQIKNGGEDVTANYNITYKTGILTIKAKDINNISSDITTTSYTYTGKAKTQDVILVDGAYTLVENTDYKVEYRNNINAGTAKVIVTGQGKYSGTIEKEFTINKNSLAIPTVDGGYTYNGTEQTVNLINGYNGELVTVSGTTAKDAGTHAITMELTEEGARNYKFEGKEESVISVNLTWIIAPKAVTVVWGELEFEYTGEAKVPTATANSGITGEEITLTVTTTPTEAIEAGTHIATATITSVTNSKATNYILTTNAETEFIILELVADGVWDNTKKVNAPQLMTGMTGVYWDEDDNEIEVTASNQNEWYDYANNKWANAKTKDGSYWVWIPRYAYKITSGLYTNTAGEIQIEFLQGTTNLNAEGEEILTTYPTVTGDAMNDFVVHPAFVDGKHVGFQNGEWDEDVAGFWVAKYEAGFQASTTDETDATKVINGTDTIKYSSGAYTSMGYSDAIAIGTNRGAMSYPVFKPLTYSYNMIRVGNAYTLCRTMTEGTAETNFYGLDSTKTDSHMMKNSEWGAVAYLTHSSYGRNKTEVTENAKNLNNLTKNIYAVTGYGSAVNDLRASSTGNITGIYDLSGGVYEYTASYIPIGMSYLIYGSSFASTTGTSHKYATVYPYSTSDYESSVSNYAVYKSAGYGFGDAMLETTLSVSYGGWNKDAGHYFYLNAGGTFCSRGRAVSSMLGNSGIFTYYACDGLDEGEYGFRAVLYAL